MASDVLSLVENALSIILVLAAEGTFAYAAYWAFNIRRGLAVRIYRNHALGVGLVSLGWILIFFDFVLVSSFNFVIFVVIQVLVSAMFFFFIDTAVLDGRMSDPLLRDTIHWWRIRQWVWAIFAAASVASIYIGAYYEGLTGANLSVLPFWVSFIGAFLEVAVVLIVGIIALPITAARSRDPFLRKQLAWLAGFVAFLVAGSPVPTSPAYAPLVFALQFAMAFCLYKSARSLVPLNRLSTLDQQPPESPEKKEA